MGNRISTCREPVIMTKAFLDDITIKNLVLTQDLDSYEFRRLVKLNGLEYDRIYSMDLESQNLMNISDLWRFKLLTTLEMPNNLLKKIEGLECLVNLQRLDLSFNFITCIKNLENLKNLIYLNLTSNEIVILENMDSLLKLESFLVRQNKIKSFDSVNYLAQFKKLSCLAIDKNPFVHESSRLQVISVLSQLKYLDYNIITSEEIKKAILKFPSKAGNRNGFEDESIKRKFKYDFAYSDKEAYVDGLANNQGFETFLMSDKNYQLLHSFPLASEIATNHKSELNKIFDKWHEIGHSYYQKIQEEKSQFLLMVSEAKEYSLNVSREEEIKFIDFKEKIPKELCLIYQNAPDEEKDKNVAEFRKVCDRHLQNTFKNFMNCNCLCMDLILNMCKLNKKETNSLHSKYISEVEIFCIDLMNINRKFANELKEFYASMHDFGLDESKECKTEEEELFLNNVSFLQLIQNKNLIKLTLDLSTRIHSTILKERINNLKSILHKDIIRTIEEVSNTAFAQQNKMLRNTTIFCNKQKYFVDKLFSKTATFKRYLGYR